MLGQHIGACTHNLFLWLARRVIKHKTTIAHYQTEERAQSCNDKFSDNRRIICASGSASPGTSLAA